MAGGTFTSYNKITPGAYINFVSTKAAVQSIGERGFVAMVLPLSYMPAGVLQLTAQEFNANAQVLFGVASDNELLQPIREAFANASTVVLVSSAAGATEATSTAYDAKQVGVLGNNISVVIENALPTGFAMSVRYNGAEVERFTASTLALLKTNVDSKYIAIKTGTTLEVGTMALSGGVDGTETMASYRDALTLIEAEYWNVLAVTSDTTDVPALVEAYIRRLRDEQGKKVTAVLHNYICDYEGITVLNALNNKAFVPWIAGAMAAVPLSRSLTNMAVVSEIQETKQFSYAEMNSAITAGLFTIISQSHQLRVLKDCNSMTTPQGGSMMFANNQIVRITDQIANDVLSSIMNAFVGVVPNDEEGRAALWSSIVTMLATMESARAIQNFDPDSVVVVQGNTPDSVFINCAIQPVGAIEIIYMTVSVV